MTTETSKKTALEYSLSEGEKEFQIVQCLGGMTVTSEFDNREALQKYFTEVFETIYGFIGFTNKAEVKISLDMRDGVLYYRLPIDRFQQFMTFGWGFINNNNCYANSHDFDLVASKEKIAEGISNAVLKIESELNAAKESYNNTSIGLYDSYFREQTDGSRGYFFYDLQSLVKHLAENEHAPQSVRDAAKSMIEE